MATLRITRLLSVLLVLSVGYVLSATASAYQDEALAYPEAVAIEDITYLGCEITLTEYADAEEESFEIVASETYEACPLGSVTRTFPTTVEEAQKGGFSYVVLTGDPAMDESLVDQLKSSLAPVASTGVVRPLAVQSSCTSANRSRTLSYYAGYPDTGAGVRTTVYYYRSTSCQWNISRATDYIFDPLTAGEDIYWDQLYYGTATDSTWDAGCVRMYDYGTYHTWTSPWRISLGQWFTDDTINDTSLGCSWWGEEYNGSVQLT
jgi:hypothetical protein